MGKKSILAISFLAILMLSILIIPNAPVKAWEYQDGTPSDTKFEKFGPRADKILIKLYSTAEAEWDALARGEIDITDWPLSKPYYDLFTSPPLNESINVVSYGAEFRFFMLDINNNNNTYLGNPPNPAYPNPVYPNPMSVKEMRQAIAYLTDRSQLDSIIGGGFYSPLYTPVSPAMGAYQHPEITPGAALENLTYPYSRAAAEAKLNAGGFPIGLDGWRYWDRNGNSVKDAGEDLNLKFFIRSDHAHERDMGNFIANELETVKVKVTRDTISEPIEVMTNKDFHLYTGDWLLDVDPDFLINWNSEFYWHPGIPNNYAGINNPLFNEYSYGVRYANTYEEATINAWQAQEVFAQNALSIPLWSYAGIKAMSRLYTGGNKWTPVSPDDGENAYRGQYWEGVVSLGGIAETGPWTFLNMHPRGYERGDGNMTIRYGFSTTTIQSFNPIYATPISEPIEVLYEPLLRRNPYNLAEFMPWLAEDFEVGTYTHSIYGTCSKVKFTLRPDATWNDGTPLTTADVYFTLVELDDILKVRGLPPPSWKSNVMDILDFRIIDPYNFEVLFSNKSIWALGWVGQQKILPMHIWKPTCEGAIAPKSGQPWDPTTFAPDPNLIGSGPWRLDEYVQDSHIALTNNKPNSTVDTDIKEDPNKNSEPTTSPQGYLKFNPIIGHLTIDGATMAKIDYYTNHTAVYELVNEWYGGPITLDLNLTVLSHNGTIVETNTTRVELEAKGTEGDDYQLEVCVFGSWWHWFFHFDYDWYSPHDNDNGHYSECCYTTITEDIVGSTLYDDMNFTAYPYKSELPSPDIKDDMKDVREAAKAFGSYPGHERWSTVADITGDYKIDMKDIRAIAKKFGWTG
jgi:ABC-type transport system substrate-binding protein